MVIRILIHLIRGTQEIPLTRSIFDPDDGNSVTSPREQINEITAYIDGSNVYGSDSERAEALRTNDGTGKLKTSVSEMEKFCFLSILMG